MAKMLDRSRPYMESCGERSHNCAFIQDWIMYDSNGRRLPKNEQEHLGKQAAVVPSATASDDDDDDDGDKAEDVGPIDPDQPFFSLKRAMRMRGLPDPKNKLEAVAALDKAGLLP